MRLLLVQAKHTAEGPWEVPTVSKVNTQDRDIEGCAAGSVIL